MPPRYTAWKKEAAEELRHQWGGPPREGPLRVDLVIMCSRPKSRRRKRTRETVVPRVGRGDIDNAVKSVLDAMEDAGIYANDNQIAQLSAVQWDAEQDPYVQIDIGPAEEFRRPGCQKTLTTEL